MSQDSSSSSSSSSSPSPQSPSDPTPPIDPTLQRAASVAHADILNFVAKQQSKSIAFKELLRHLIFTAIFLTIVSLHRSVFESYLMNQSLTTAFVTQEIDFELQNFAKTLPDVHQPTELRDYLIGVLGETLDTEYDYSGTLLQGNERNFVMMNNRLIGGVRFRQLRAAPNRGCVVPSDLKGLVPACFAYGYSSSNRDTRSFGPPEYPDKYRYQTAEETGSTSTYANMLFSLEGGGYVVDMPLGSNFTDRIQELIRDGWWGPQTRAIIITMNYLNIDMGNRVAVMNIILEMPGCGEVFPMVSFRTFRLDLYVYGADWFRMILELLFLLILLYMIIREIEEMRECYRSRRGLRKYFHDGWNLNEITTIVFLIAAIGFYIRYLVSCQNHGDLSRSEYTPKLEQIGAQAAVYYNLTYFNILLLSFETFKYLQMNRRLYMLWKTLSHAGTNLFGFIFIFLIFVFGFVFTAWMTFGADIPYFSSFSLSFGTCWNFLVGNPPDYGTLVLSNPVLGPIFYTLFTIFVFFILANVFIAIVGNSFAVVSKSVADQMGIKDAIEEKISHCFKSTKSIARKVFHRSGHKKRTILQILESLAYPEILDQPVVTIDDVFRACGPNTTEAEAWDLYEWIQKLESKKKFKSARRMSNVKDSDDSEETGSEGGTEMKPLQKTTEYLELQAAVDALREDMKHLTQLLLSNKPSPKSPPKSRKRKEKSPIKSDDQTAPSSGNFVSIIVSKDPPSSSPPSPVMHPDASHNQSRDHHQTHSNSPSSSIASRTSVLSIIDLLRAESTAASGPPPPSPQTPHHTNTTSHLDVNSSVSQSSSRLQSHSARSNSRERSRSRSSSPPPISHPSSTSSPSPHGTQNASSSENQATPLTFHVPPSLRNSHDPPHSKTPSDSHSHSIRTSTEQPHSIRTSTEPHSIRTSNEHNTSLHPPHPLHPHHPPHHPPLHLNPHPHLHSHSHPHPHPHHPHPHFPSHPHIPHLHPDAHPLLHKSQTHPSHNNANASDSEDDEDEQDDHHSGTTSPYESDNLSTHSS